MSINPSIHEESQDYFQRGYTIPICYKDKPERFVRDLKLATAMGWRNFKYSGAYGCADWYGTSPDGYHKPLPRFSLSHAPAGYEAKQDLLEWLASDTQRWERFEAALKQGNLFELRKTMVLQPDEVVIVALQALEADSNAALAAIAEAEGK